MNGDRDVGVVLAKGEPALRIDARLKDERRLLENLEKYFRPKNGILDSNYSYVLADEVAPPATNYVQQCQ
jgi:hypothetical protein